jgi:hypothetical protein
MHSRLVVLQSIGQLGNRLTHFAHLIAFAASEGIRVFNPSFSIYSEFFQGTRDNLLCSYPARHGRSFGKASQRTLYYILRAAALAGVTHINKRWITVNLHWTAGDYDLERPAFRQLTDQYNTVFLTGSYRHRCFGGLERAAPDIREYFQLVPRLQSRVTKHMAPIKNRADIVVGLHVRQGDNFTDVVRRDAFSSEEYAEVARRINTCFPGKTVHFMMCSNVEQPREVYKGLNISHGPGDFVSDMYSLAECDYIIGPGQSSFTAWASFMGQKPFYPLFNPKAEFGLEDFKVCQRLG